MKDKNVYLIDTKLYDYNNEKEFNAADVYPEGLSIKIKSDPKIYENIRNLLISMKLDKKNIGTKNWNPFNDFIKKGDVVVLKPNFVKHINMSDEGDTDSLITNFSVIRPLIDYTIKALDGTGRIILGDAPVQECNFDEVIKLYGLKESIERYNSNGYHVELVDFRKNNNEDLKCKLVDLKKNSSLCEVDKYAKKYAITNYDLRYMHSHHNEKVHEYLFPEFILDANVIINIPKPKVHRKAGITACMKNFVGVNSKKEYLPHHRNGSVHNNGDEYPERSIIKNIVSSLQNYSYKKSKLLYLFTGVFYKIQSIMKKNRYLEGSWYGNDTIWRTILDINKILIYSDRNGKLQKKPQRLIFNVADMIVCGEKEGPLLPSNKKVGYLVASFNQLNADKTICEIMGFDPDKIKYIKHGYDLKKYKISESTSFNIIDENGITSSNKYKKQFIPTDGWIDYLMDNDKQ